MKHELRYGHRIGIIGGAGVAATNLLLQRIEQNITRAGAFRDSHHPETFVCQATRSPSRSMYYEGRGRSFIPDYKLVAKSLESSGATLIAMCCNTAHAAFDEISSSVSVTFVDLVAETAELVKRTGCVKIGLIASDGCIESGVYQKHFQYGADGAEIVLPSEGLQRTVSKAIRNIKNIRRFASDESIHRPASLFNDVLRHLESLGCDAVILGCTDIAVDWDSGWNSKIKVFDSLDILASHLSREYINSLPGNSNAAQFYDKLSARIRIPSETRNRATDTSDLDVSFILKNSNDKSRLLDLGSGTGLLVNRLANSFTKVVAVEKYPELSKFIETRGNVSVITSDLLDLNATEIFSTVTIFATLNYFNLFEATKIYRLAFQALQSGGRLIVKHQMGIDETVSIELDEYYFSEYRTLTEEIEIIKLAGFSNVQTTDIYPPQYNRYDNTHFFAIVADKVSV